MNYGIVSGVYTFATIIYVILFVVPILILILFIIMFSKVCKMEKHLCRLSNINTDMCKMLHDITRSTLNKNGEISLTQNKKSEEEIVSSEVN